MPQADHTETPSSFERQCFFRCPNNFRFSYIITTKVENLPEISKYPSKISHQSMPKAQRQRSLSGLTRVTLPQADHTEILREALIFQEPRSPQGPTKADLLKIYQRSPSPTQECRMKRIPKARPTISLENL
jgi:hypothetical protein